jgi:hypothetical protein
MVGMQSVLDMGGWVCLGWVTLVLDMGVDLCIMTMTLVLDIGVDLCIMTMTLVLDIGVDLCIRGDTIVLDIWQIAQSTNDCSCFMVRVLTSVRSLMLSHHLVSLHCDQ